MAEEKKLKIEYSFNPEFFDKKEGGLDGSIHLFEEDKLIGSIFETTSNMALIGYQNSEEIQILKIPESDALDVVYWRGTFEKEENCYKGGFGIIPIDQQATKIMYDSIIKSLKNIKESKPLEEISENLIDRLKKNPFELPYAGTGILKID